MSIIEGNSIRKKERSQRDENYSSIIEGPESPDTYKVDSSFLVTASLMNERISMSGRISNNASYKSANPGYVKEFSTSEIHLNSGITKTHKPLKLKHPFSIKIVSDTDTSYHIEMDKSSFLMPKVENSEIYSSQTKLKNSNCKELDYSSRDHPQV